MENQNCNNGEQFKDELAHLKEEIQHEKEGIAFEEKQIQHEKQEVEYLEQKVEELERREHEHCELLLIINAEEKPYHESQISFKKVVELAFDAMQENDVKAYTVTYKNGPKENPEGSLVYNKTVKVQNKMRFNVTQTNKS